MMGWFDRILGRASSPEGGAQGMPAAWSGWFDPADPYVAELFGDCRGGTVGEKTALRVSPLFRAANLISGTVGALPANLLRKGADGAPEKAADHPVQKLLRVSPLPARRQTPFAFKSYMQGRALMRGNAYAYIIPGVRGPQALRQLDPSRIRVGDERDDGALEYVWQRPKGGERRFSQKEIFHLRAPWSSDGVTGDGLLEIAARAVRLADDSSEAAARMLRNGSYVGGTLEHPKTLSAEAILRLREQFAERFQGVENAGRWMVLEEGMKATSLGTSGRDAEGLGQRKMQVEEIARLTGVPRPLLMMDETSWGSGIEQLGLFFVIYCLMPWLVSWEEELAAALLTERERETHYIKFNEAALLRGSLKDQAEFLSKALGGPGQTGFMMPNEARDKMDLPPADGGDRPNWGQLEGDSNAAS